MGTSASMVLAARRMEALEAWRNQEKNPWAEKTEPFRKDPANIFLKAGLIPDRWQAKVVRSSIPRLLMLTGRQNGKSLCASVLALKTMFLKPQSLVLIVSPTQKQSSEFFKAKLKYIYDNLGRPIETVQESALSMELANGSRVVCTPGKDSSVRGYSAVDLMVVDEASRVLDDLYQAVRPMLMVSKGSLVALTTPFGKRGWFYDAWSESPVLGKTDANVWERIKVTSLECPRATKAFLAEEKLRGERYFNQEHMCSFEDVVGSVFAHDDIQGALIDGDGFTFPPMVSEEWEEEVMIRS